MLGIPSLTPRGPTLKIGNHPHIPSSSCAFYRPSEGRGASTLLANQACSSSCPQAHRDKGTPINIAIILGPTLRIPREHQSLSGSGCPQAGIEDPLTSPSGHEHGLTSWHRCSESTESHTASTGHNVGAWAGLTPGQTRLAGPYALRNHLLFRRCSSNPPDIKESHVPKLSRPPASSCRGRSACNDLAGPHLLCWA